MDHVKKVTARANKQHAKLKSVGVVPHSKPVPWCTFFVLLVFVSCPPLLFITLFSAMGYGVSLVASFGDDEQTIAGYCSIAIGGIMSSLYLLDFSSWTSAYGRFMRLFLLIFCAVCMVIYLLLSAKTAPSGLIILYTLGTVGWFIASKHLIFSKAEFRDYVSWLTGPLLLASVVTLTVFMIWVKEDVNNEWNDRAKVYYAKKFNWDETLNLASYTDLELDKCFYNYTAINATYHGKPDWDGLISDPDVSHFVVGVLKPCFPMNDQNSSYFSESCLPYCTRIYDTCTASFLIWATPMIISVVLFFLSFVCGFLNPESAASAPTTFFKIFIMLLFGLWCTASLSGAGAGLAQSFSAFMLAASMGIAMIVLATFGVPSSTADLAEMEFFKSFKKKFGGAIDFIRAMIVVTSSPVVGMYCCCSFVNQVIRRTGLFPCSKKLDKAKGEHKLWLTQTTTDQIADFKRWDHAKIYSWAVVIGLVYIVMQVLAAKWTVLFLSWMRLECESMSFIMVSIIIVVVGMCLFLLPPIPGVPIYLTGGLMIPAVATGIGLGDGPGEDDTSAAPFPMNVTAAICYTIVVGVCLKLFACTLQQKMFGENMSGFVGIRQACNINSPMIRTMKLILQKPGLSITKVAILVGGPDWPTSVLCGIMRLPLSQVLLGTLPVFFLIVPTVMAGSFMWMAGLTDADRQPRYEIASTLSMMFMVIAAGVQSGSMVVAAFYLEKAVAEQGDEIAAMPIDQEVQDADDRGAQRRLMYSYVTQWHFVPYVWKKVLHFAVCCIVMSCYLAGLTNASVDYTLTNQPSDLPDGKWYNLLTMKGWAAMALFCIAWFALTLFQRWAKRRVAEFEKSGELLPAEWLEQQSSVVNEELLAVAEGGSENVKANVAINKVVPVHDEVA